MRIATHAVAITTGLVGLFGTVFAADLAGDDLKAYLSGKTIYLETTAASASGQAGQGIIFWAENGTAIFKTASGAILHGNWEIKGNTNCTVWKERPGTGCTRYDKVGDTVTVIDATSGQIRAKVVKSVPGNAEKLGP